MKDNILCNGIAPQRWADAALNAYKNKGGETNITKYLETITTNRSRDGATSYDAYEEDMAEVVFFFNREANSIGLKCI